MKNVNEAVLLFKHKLGIIAKMVSLGSVKSFKSHTADPLVNPQPHLHKIKVSVFPLDKKKNT